MVLADWLVRGRQLGEDCIELRIAVVGNVDAGKSTMLGVLTHGALDDGRGKCRSKIFRHKHEVAPSLDVCLLTRRSKTRAAPAAFRPTFWASTAPVQSSTSRATTARSTGRRSATTPPRPATSRGLGGMC